MKKKVFTKHYYGNDKDLSDDSYYFQKWIAENDIIDSDYRGSEKFGCSNIFLLTFILVILAVILHCC